jgi:hypothetical protein
MKVFASALPEGAGSEHRCTRPMHVAPVALGFADLNQPAGLFPSLCFPPSVSLYGFPPWAQQAAAPPSGVSLASRLGFRGRGVRRFAPDPPSSTCQVNLDRPAQARSWRGLRRGGGKRVRGRADEGRGGKCERAEGVNGRGDARGSLGARRGRGRGRRRARVADRGVGGGSSGSGVSAWRVGGCGTAVCCCGSRGDVAAVAQHASSVRVRCPGLARQRR